MSDLIDREALLKQIDIDSEGEPGYYGDTWKFIDTIKRMPSAEPKRGRWEMTTLGDMFMMDAPRIIYCSACNVCSAHATPYCPICGAKMEDKNE